MPSTAPQVELRCRGRTVAVHNSGADIDPRLSPRPFLHPVRTLAGTVVTEVFPDDHPHHLGVSVAVPDVSGASFWGGTTYVRDQGSVLLEDHGRQRHQAWLREEEEHRVELLSWTGPQGPELLQERRETAALDIGDGVWALDLRTRLHNTCGRALHIGSPATNGRPGAGYGGFFWRMPITGQAPRCFGPEDEGEGRLHGARTGWLALSGADREGAPWTLVFIAGGPVADPWFLRAEEYPGVGAALAWDRPLEVAAGAEVHRRVTTLVADGHPEHADVAELVAAARGRMHETGGGSGGGA